MDRSWSIDEMVTKASFAHIVTIAESPLDENRLYAGSGDGLLHYTHDGGENWTKATLEGLPEFARIHHIVASPHDADVAYAACHNFFTGDFGPYLYKTVDGGATWSNISADLPEYGSTYTVGVDHVDENLLFVGTMTGVFVSNTPEVRWGKLEAGLPTSVTVMDLDLQRDEGDLVVSTFGRGVYILDDYSPLRHLDAETLESDSTLFPVTDAPMFVQADPMGFPGVGFQGASYFSAPNPPVGAAITYYVKEGHKSLKDLRNEAEEKLQEAGEDVELPDYEQRRREALEEDPYLLFVISDADGNPVRSIKKDIAAGVQRVVWDFRTSPVGPISLEDEGERDPWDTPELGHMVIPGEYRVSMVRVQDDSMTPVGSTQSFDCRPLNIASLPADDIEALETFNTKVASLSRAISAADAHRGSLAKRLPYLAQAALSARVPEALWLAELPDIKIRLREIDEAINGDRLLLQDEGQSRMSLKGRTDLIVSSLWVTTSGPTGTYRRAYDEACEDFGDVLANLEALDNRIRAVEDELEAAGAPYTPGRLPVWEGSGS